MVPLDQDSATHTQTLAPLWGQTDPFKTPDAARGVGWYPTADADSQEELQTSSASSSARREAQASDKSTCQEPAARPEVDRVSSCHSHVT